MKRLMFGHLNHPLMDEAGDNNGEGGGGAAGATETAETTTQTQAAVGDVEAKPYLGGDSGEQKPAATDAASDAEKPADAPKEYGEEDYVKGIVKDESLLGNDANVSLDEGYIKAMAPTFKELGIAPEQASRLANAFAKVQIESAREEMKRRNDYFETMKQESLRKYGANDWAQINAAIDAHFKVGGTMNYVIRNSELGADPEFLALLHTLGAAVKKDTVVGAGAGSGAGVGDGNSFNGISSMW